MTRGKIATAALVALVVVDVVLIAFALRPHDAPDAGSVRVSVDQPTTEPSAPQPSPPPTTEAPEQPPPAVPLARLIDASSATEAWRLVKGSCQDGGGAVERTSDGGATWDEVTTDADAFVRLRARGATDAFVVALSGDGCAPAFLTTTDGETWSERPASLDAAWYIEPADATAVHSPDGIRAGPCEAAPVVDLAGVTTTRAGVLCPDGRVFTTDDAATSWALRVAVPGGVALTDAGDGYLVGALGAAGCPGVQVVSAGEGTAEALGCSSASDQPGSVDVAAVGDAVWLWAGDAVQVSGDGGRTWP